MNTIIILARPILRISYRILLLVCFMSIFSSLYSYAYAENYYRWVDKDGVTHMTDYPAEDLQPAGTKITKEHHDGSNSLQSNMKKFIAKSKEWLKPGIKDIASTVQITYQKNNVYNVKITSNKEIKPFGAVEPDDVIFYSFCVASYFASQNGFNGWAMSKNDVSGEKNNGKQGMQYSITLGIGGPKACMEMRHNCSRFVRPEFLCQTIPIEQVLKNSTNKSICRRFLEIQLDRDEYMRSIHQKNSQTMKGNNNFQYFLDIDRNRKMDEIFESIKLESGKTVTYLDVKCAGNDVAPKRTGHSSNWE